VARFYETDDTICALATPPAAGALALVRLSGPRAYQIATGALDIKLPPRGRLRGRHFVRRVELGEGLSIESVVICFLAPHSYTGEDALEFSLPGNMLIVEKLLTRLREAGARPAEPGEFTYRAYLNGKLDLAQAEAVNGAIRAGSETLLRLTLNELSGEASQQVEGWLSRLNAILAGIEVVHDYPGDTDEAPAGNAVEDIIALLDELRAHLEFHRAHRRLREGLKAVILGAPNVGKSTLFNRLLGYDRAIVSEAPGTTRDYLEEPVSFGGVQLSLVDTAGLRQAAELVEMMGVERAQKLLGEADAVILVEEVFHFSPQGREPLPRLADMLSRIEQAQLPALLVVNKIDTVSGEERAQLTAAAVKMDAVTTNAKSGEGLEAVREFLRKLAQVEDSSVRFLLTERSGALVQQAAEALARALEAIGAGLATDAVAVDLYDAQRALAGILAAENRDMVIDEVFRRFCLGK
jgi:tRNA modification GTPase